jgi:chromate transporter
MPGQGTEGEIAGGPREPTSAAIAEPFRASLVTVLRQWGRIGCTGFGGPPTHIKMLRDLCVDREGWLDAVEFEDAVGACNLLPGPASTELAIFCAWRVRGRLGALVGGVAFIVPGLIVILALAAVFLSGSPPRWVLGAGAGAGAAVAAVAVQAAWSLTPASSVEAGIRHVYRDHAAAHGVVTVPLLAAGTISGGVLLSVAWVAFKVGALSFGGGFVIIPLMQADAVSHYHWMTGGQFLNAVALGQITPGPDRGLRRLRRRRHTRRAARLSGRVLAVLRVHPARRTPLRPPAR